MSEQLAHAWMPHSPCGPTCLPRRGHGDEVGLGRVVGRVGRICVALAVGITVAAAVPIIRGRRRTLMVRWWFGSLLQAFGVSVEIHGDPRVESERGLLIACNHVSWLDIVALLSVRPVRLLAKSELRAWPVVGPIAAKVGTLFIDRESLRGLPDAVRGVREALRAGAVVGVFAEGTTWCGLASGTHRPALFQAAVDAGSVVQPIALRFRTASGQQTTAAAFVGDGTLVVSLWKVLRANGLVVEMTALAPMDSRSISDRRELARRVEHGITAITQPAAPAEPHPGHALAA